MAFGRELCIQMHYLPFSFSKIEVRLEKYKELKKKHYLYKKYKEKTLS